MNIVFDGEKLASEITWGDLAALESGSLSKSLETMSKYIVQDGKTLSAKDGRKVLEKIPSPQISKIVSAFWRALREGAVNPTNGG